MNLNKKVVVSNNDWLHHLGGDQGIDVWFTSRGVVHDGDPYSGFNVCHYVGDDTKHVEFCRNALCDRIGVELSSLIIPRQTHSSKVIAIDHLHYDVEDLEGVDGLVTRLPNVVMGISTADCVPVVLYDGNHGVMGVVHAGWKGAVAGIVENAIQALVGKGAQPQQIKALFGPSICVDCFEVGEEVAMLFPDSCVERRQEWERPHVNLHRFITGKLLSMGIQPKNIKEFDKDLCTKCHPELFFSARNLGIKSGRIFTFITQNHNRDYSGCPI